MLKIYSVTGKNLPAFNVHAYGLNGALAKAPRMAETLYGPKAASVELTVTFKRNAR